MTSQHRMPALFFGHGSPMNALERNRYTDAWRAAAASMPAPRAVLVVSAHWYVRGTRVTAQARPTTIHDFGGFPRALHAFDYPAPGDPALAARVRDLLAPTDVALDEAWGFDHGTWSVLTHLFERADVPVVQLSLDGRIGLADHFAIASRLEPLRDEGVLIVGTGNVVHNLHAMRYGDGMPAYDWATRFEERITAAAVAGDAAPLLDLAGADAASSVPTVEHYLPLLYAFAQRRTATTVLTSGIESASISMLSLRFD
jgi:4,5-DOPA dioxygenase extradiol